MRLSLASKFRERVGTRGIQKFGSLLIKELQERFGVKIVDNRSDIHLNIIQGQRKPGAKNIVRLDGVYYDVGRLGMNKPIKKSLLRVDGVIYQSNWAKKFVEGMLKAIPAKSTVVYNGAKTSLYASAAKNKFGFDKVMLCCANWRANKRLKAIISAFQECKNTTGMNLGLFVVGKPDYTCVDPSVKFFGTVTQQIYSLYASSDYMCHICHLDACPNSVVEGLCAGIPVLSNNIGGTPEIVGSDGIISKLDAPFDFKPVKSMKTVSKVDREILTSDMIRLVGKEWKVERKDLDISASAAGYHDFFMELLK